jgi:hypothetical protein
MDKNVFQGELLNGEKILWEGQPDRSILFTKADIFLIPFSALWFGFVLFWSGSVFFLVPKNHPVDILFLAFGTFFFLIGFYYAIGRFIYKKIKKDRTYYAVTNKRIIIIYKLFGRNVVTANINTLPSINKSINAKGGGTLIFTTTNLNQSIYANTGLDLFGWGAQDILAFYDIKNVEEVYKKITTLQIKEIEM